MATPGEMLEAAIAYARRGWCVFPLVVGGKTPAVSGGFKSATRDEAQIEAWWSRSAHNIGIATGAVSNLYVIDIDVYDTEHKRAKCGLESLLAIEQAHGVLVPALRVRTGSGGLQYFYSHVADLRNTAAALGVDIDTRGDGGYVVAPPSVHPNGQRYKWERV